MRHVVRRRSPLLLSLLAALLVAGGCASGGGDSGADGDRAGFSEGSAPEEVAPEEVADRPRDLDDGLRDSAALSEGYGTEPEDSTSRRIIAKGNVSLRSDDVATAAFRVQEVADQYGGEVTERETTTNKDGEISTARLLLRIPVADFDKAFVDLQDVADLQSSSTGKEDVTTKVIDTQVRIRAQRRSLLRVEALLDRAQSISDIIRIEAHLTRRQADLESLERRLAYLTDQTSMSTVSVNISLPPKEKEPTEKEEPEEVGFLAGLEDGWKALKSFGTDVATLTGQVLPFAGVLLVLGAPLWFVVRRVVRRRGDGAVAPAHQ